MLIRNRALTPRRCSAHLRHVNRLYFGDNLKWLRDKREFPNASVDLGRPPSHSEKLKRGKAESFRLEQFCLLAKGFW